MPKRRCLDCGKVCYGWSPGPCPYCRSSNLEPLSGQSLEEDPRCRDSKQRSSRHAGGIYLVTATMTGCHSEPERSGGEESRFCRRKGACSANSEIPLQISVME